ncbi:MULTISPECIES: hypothetical protein [Marinobacter]|uniref:Uncharacterized protein n=1 Tax=Marinobacter alkaliphilus TaxID=254719 RepID=A0ABZ3E9H7_9GAMM|nr:hypothetical protein [Marinobacter sp. P4B1]
MIGVIEKTPIADLIPLGKGLFRGEGELGNQTIRFLIRLGKDGRVYVLRAVAKSKAAA